MTPHLEPLELRTLPDTAGIYHALLHRDPEPGAVAAWTSYGLPADQQAALTAASPEYALRNPDWLGGLYSDLLGRSVDPVGVLAWMGAGPYRTTLGILHSQEYALHTGIDPVPVPGGTLIAVGDLTLGQPATLSDPFTGVFVNPDGTVQTLPGLQTLVLPVQQFTRLQILPNDGSAPLDVLLPHTPLGTGLEPSLTVDAADGTVYLAVAGSEAGTGGASGLQVFASTDGGRSFALRGTLGGWSPGTQLAAPQITADHSTLTLTYVVPYAPTTWSGNGPRHSDAGQWTATSPDGGVSWDGRGVQV